MKKFGKWIGAGLGWTIGGPIGAMLGFAFGSFVDASDLEKYESSSQNTTTGDFVLSLLVIMAALMKADRKVMKSELTFVKNYLTRAFGEEETKEMLVIMRDLLKKDIPLKEVTYQIRNRMDYPSRLQLMHLLYGIAMSDGHVAESEIVMIEIVGNDLGMHPPDMDSLRNMFVASADKSYKILEVDRSATNDEIKKAYRQLALKNHPDKVAYLGEEIRIKAQEKFQKIQEAFETIKKERGF
jgi:DnaJ like chaperone protein